MYKSILAVPALLAATAVSPLFAGNFDHNRTVMTFPSAVQIAGEPLAAGTYVFETVPNNTNVVVVKNEKEDHLVGVFLTNSITTPAPHENTVVQLSERGTNEPPALHAWFFPGETIGWQFDK